MRLRTERADKRAAAIQSLLGTAKPNGFGPLTWLTTTLEKLPTCPHSQTDKLPPLKSLPE